MLRQVREASSRVVARVVGSRFAKPIARVALATAGLLLLALIGKTAVAGAIGTGTGTVPAVVSAAALASAAPPLPTQASEPAASQGPPPASPPVSTSASRSSSRATPDDPVILNTATVDDLRRLPGIGEKRATAAIALRTRLGGRFHAIEDLLKVKGVGRTTLRRLRPLVRLDPPPLPEGGAEAPR
ncbi:MAG TPA: helix-hairpin-helix domain-containing protein [Polyangiaceae bacterium]|jgi:competence protein ComEA